MQNSLFSGEPKYYVQMGSKHLIWIEKFRQNSEAFSEEFLGFLFDEADIDLETYESFVLVIDFLIRSQDEPLDSDGRHFAKVFGGTNEYDEMILECIDGLQDLYVDSHSLKNELATRALVQLSEKVGDWFEEIMVIIAELAELPKDLIPWFLKRNKAPFASDGDFFNGSRTGRAGVAFNKNTPEEILWDLSKDDGWEIKWRLAMNPNSPKELLDFLINVEDDMADVFQACVAMNLNTSNSTLMSLVENSSPDLRTLASKNPKASDAVAKRANELGIVKRPFKDWSSSLAWILDRKL